MPSVAADVGSNHADSCTYVSVPLKWNIWMYMAAIAVAAVVMATDSPDLMLAIAVGIIAVAGVTEDR